MSIPVDKPDADTTALKRPSFAKRSAISISQGRLIKIDASRPLPLVIEPAVEAVNLLAWASNNKEFVRSQLLKYGGLLFRNFTLKTVPEFEQLIETISGSLLKYTYRSTPRSEVSGNIYTSTEYPADQHIPLHNEMAYSTSWPMKISFFCAQPAQQGGETPIADSRKVFQRIAPEIRERFIEKEVLYVRNYGGGLDLPWQTVFQTTSKSDVEAYCKSAGMEYDWKDGDRLRTRQVCQSAALHPETGETVWFNQAHLFHVSSLKPEVRDYLLLKYKDEDFPRNAYYGDGSPIEEPALENIRHAYEQESVVLPWKQLDILMLDNMLTAHGRRPYAGSRRVLAGMAEPSGEKNI